MSHLRAPVLGILLRKCRRPLPFKSPSFETEVDGIGLNANANKWQFEKLPIVFITEEELYKRSELEWV